MNLFSRDLINLSVLNGSYITIQIVYESIRSQIFAIYLSSFA